MTQLTSLDPGSIPSELLEKYGTRGPRYTSYPTAPHFSEDFDRDTALTRWQGIAGNRRPISIYLHVPFCPSRCLYCGCTTETGHDDAIKSQYVDRLITELRYRADIVGNDHLVAQLALGGGTPTHLASGDLDRLFSGLREVFQFDPMGERSIEVDPRRICSNYLDILLSHGFNRVSLGVQDLDPMVQEAINRVMPAEKLSDIMVYLQQNGCKAINIDLMYGLPGQTCDTISKTVDAIVQMKPTRIALFGYAHVPWMSPHQKELERYELPDAQLRTELFSVAWQRLTEAGYIHIGMDHFALPEDELSRALEQQTLTRNFMGYTTRRGLDLVATGATAIGAVNGTYTQNIKDVKAYMNAEPRDTWLKGYILSDDDILRRDLITELFCNFHLDISALESTYDLTFADHFSTECDRLVPFIDDGLMTMDARQINVTSVGRFFVRNICMVFDQYLKKGAARYSKTV